MIMDLSLGSLLQTVGVFDNLISFKLLGLDRLPTSLCEMIPAGDEPVLQPGK